jgi:cytochrome c biogenesis protein CcmG, thiol:disulfide interchange protein DsbE
MRPTVVIGFVVAVGALGAFVLAAYSMFGKDTHAVPFMMQGKPAPHFVLTDLNTGKRVSLADFKGRPLVINFWATWCGPCVGEHDTIQASAVQFGDQAQFLGVVYEDTEENAKGFLVQRPTSYPQMLDANGSMAVDYAVTGVPETYFVDAQGVIRGKWANVIDRGRMMACIQEVQTPGTGGGMRCTELR